MSLLAFADLTSLFCNLRFPPPHPVNPVHPVFPSGSRGGDEIYGINRIDEPPSRSSSFVRIRVIRGGRIFSPAENPTAARLPFADLTSLFFNLRFPPPHPVHPVHPVSSSAEGRKDGMNGINRIVRTHESVVANCGHCTRSMHAPEGERATWPPCHRPVQWRCPDRASRLGPRISWMAVMLAATTEDNHRVHREIRGTQITVG